MIKSQRRLAAAVALLLSIPLSALATDVQFVGSGTFQVSGDSVTVNFDRLENFDSNVTSGSLYLQLWASPDNDPAGSGYELTEQQDLSTFSAGGNGTLAPGEAFINITFTVPYTPPPTGTYYVFLLVSEYPNLDTILDAAPAVNNPHNLGPDIGDGSGGGGTVGSHDSITMVCSPCRYNVDGGQVTFEVSAIENSRSSGTSGPLKLKLWATENDDFGSTGGYILSETNLGTLRAGFRLTDLVRTAEFTRPPAGSYFITLALTESIAAGDATRDYLTFDSPQTFSNGGGNPGGGTGSGQLRLVCDPTCSYEIDDDFVTLQAGRIENSRSTSTGTLRLSLWATETIYESGDITGYILAEATLGTLAGENAWRDVEATRAFDSPPSGTYYITLVLSEFDGTEYVIADHSNFETRQTFSSSSGGGSGTGPGSSGGAGSGAGDSGGAGPSPAGSSGGGGGGTTNLSYILMILGLGMTLRLRRHRSGSAQLP